MKFFYLQMVMGAMGAMGTMDMDIITIIIAITIVIMDEDISDEL